MDNIKLIAKRAVSVGKKWGIRVKQEYIEGRLSGCYKSTVIKLLKTKEDREFMRIIIQSVIE